MATGRSVSASPNYTAGPTRPVRATNALITGWCAARNNGQLINVFSASAPTDQCPERIH